ncbi:MAG: hypothetical protein IJW03_03870 [Clostridia bacterium]|nr:hypothetical protein [Clostridia bacterium]
MAKSALREFIEGYEQSDERNGESRGKRFFCRSFSGTVTPVMLHFSKRGILKFFSTLSKRIQYMSTKALGASFLAFGIVTIILSFLADYGSATGEAATISFIIGVALALLAIPLLLSDEIFAYIFQNVRALDKFLFDFLCINRVPKSEGTKSVPIAVMAVLGALLGFLGYFLPVWWVLFIVLVAVFVYIAFGSPEFAFFSTFFVAPYVSHIPYGQWILVALVALSSLSFVRKVLSGKRVFSFEQYDALVLFIIALTVTSGVFAKGEGGFTAAVLMAAFMLGYFLSSNLITNRRLADCMIIAVFLSSVAPSVIAYYEFITAAVQDSAEALLAVGVSSVFTSTETFAVFLLISIAFAMALIAQSSGFLKLLCITVMIFDIGALVMCSEPFALFALALGIVLYVVLGFRKTWTGGVTFALAAVPYLAVMLIALINPAFLSIGELVSVWGASLGAFVYNIVIGIGVNPESFSAVISDVGGASSASNIFIETGLDIGIFALAAFILLLVIRTRHRTIYHGYIKHSEISMISPVIAVATFSIVAFGTAADVFSDSSSYYLFWCVFGAGSATLRVAKKAYDDRVLYFEDTIDSESSVVDVKIL